MPDENPTTEPVSPINVPATQTIPSFADNPTVKSPMEEFAERAQAAQRADAASNQRAASQQPADDAPDVPDESPVKPAADPAKPRDPFDMDGLTPPKAPERKAQWAELKAERDKWRAEAEALKTRTATAADPEELTTLRQQLKTYQEQLRDVAIERTPEFKAKFEPKRTAAIETARLAAGDKGDEIAKILASNAPDRDAKIDAMMEDFTPAVRRRLDAALNALVQIETEQSLEISSARANWETRQQKLQEEARNAVQDRAARVAQTLQRYGDPSSNGIPFLCKKEGDDAHNRTVDEIHAVAQRIATDDGLTSDEIARVAVMAASFPRVIQDYYKLSSENAQLKKQLNVNHDSVPGLGYSDGDQSGSDPSDDISPTDPMYAASFAERLQRAQQADRQTTGW